MGVLLTSNPEQAVSSCRAITRAQFEWKLHVETTLDGVNLDYNIIIKSKSKLEWRAIAFHIAMSRRNLGGKYRCRPSPDRECARAAYLREAEGVNRTARDWCHLLGANFVDHVVCFKSNLNWRVLRNYDISMLNRSACLPMGSPPWWRLSLCSSGSSLVFWCRRCGHQWGRRCIEWDSHWFQDSKIRFCGIQSTTSWPLFII